MTKRFTGWHMAAILVGFFALVVAVNVTMARFATSTPIPPRPTMPNVFPPSSSSR